MKTIEIDDDIYEHLCRNTQNLGESASAILRRLLKLEDDRKGVVGSSNSVPETRQTVTPATATPASFLPALGGGGKKVVEEAFQPALSLRLAELIRRLSRLRTKQVLDRYLVILEWLYDQDPTGFECVGQLRGNSRVYFSKNEKEIERSGTSTFPKRIGKTPWFALTNTSTAHKRSDLESILKRLHWSQHESKLVLALLEGASGVSGSSQVGSVSLRREQAPPPVVDDDPFKI